jgi:hypothetical protein
MLGFRRVAQRRDSCVSIKTLIKSAVPKGSISTQSEKNKNNCSVVAEKVIPNRLSSVQVSKQAPFITLT